MVGTTRRIAAIRCPCSRRSYPAAPAPSNEVVRVDATVTVAANGPFPVLGLDARLNYKFSSVAGYGTACAPTHPYCTISATFWFDLDAMEAKYPGTFIGQPLTVSVGGGNFLGAGAGASYWASFSAEVAKNK